MMKWKWVFNKLFYTYIPQQKAALSLNQPMQHDGQQYIRKYCGWKGRMREREGETLTLRARECGVRQNYKWQISVQEDVCASCRQALFVVVLVAFWQWSCARPILLPHWLPARDLQYSIIAVLKHDGPDPASLSSSTLIKNDVGIPFWSVAFGSFGLSNLLGLFCHMSSSMLGNPTNIQKKNTKITLKLPSYSLENIRWLLQIYKILTNRTWSDGDALRGCHVIVKQLSSQCWSCIYHNRRS